LIGGPVRRLKTLRRCGSIAIFTVSHGENSPFRHDQNCRA
jgi:hypothetical protein